jgi:hypothetical protein
MSNSKSSSGGCLVLVIIVLLGAYAFCRLLDAMYEDELRNPGWKYHISYSTGMMQTEDDFTNTVTDSGNGCLSYTNQYGQNKRTCGTYQLITLR